MNCPAPELLAAMAEEKTSPAERETLLLHLADCATCRRVMLLVSAERGTARRTAVPRARFPWGAVAAAMLIGVAAFLFWKLQPPTPDSPVAIAPSQSPRPTAAPSDVPAPSPSVSVPAPAPPAPPPPPSRIPAPPDPEPPKVSPTPVPTTIPEPPKPLPTTQPTPRREIAAVRILDITGELISAKKKVVEGTLTTSLAANSPASFRIKDDLVAMTKGTVATVGKSGGSLAIVVESGEACVESQGASWLLGDQEVVLKGRALVSKTGVVLVSELPEKEATRRIAPFKNLRPRQRTWVFEDFADKPAGILTAVADGPVLRAGILVDVPWTRKFSVQFRYRTTASTLTVQVGIPTDGQPTAWIARSATSKGWQELTIPAARFENALVDPKEPPADSRIVELAFLIDPEDAPKGKAVLEIDDVVLIERD